MDNAYRHRDPRDAVIYLDPGNTGAQSLAEFRQEVRQVLLTVGPGTPLSLHVQSGAGFVAIPVLRSLIQVGAIDPSLLDLVCEATPVLSPWTTYRPDQYAEGPAVMASQALAEHVPRGTGEVFPNNLANRALNQATRNIMLAQADVYFSSGFRERVGPTGVERIAGNLDLNPAGVLGLEDAYRNIDLREDLMFLRRQGARALFVNGIFDHSVNPTQGFLGAQAFANGEVQRSSVVHVAVADTVMDVFSVSGPGGGRVRVVQVQAGHMLSVELGNTALARAIRDFTEARMADSAQ